MPGISRAALLDRISEDPDFVVDFLVAMRILGPSPRSTETLLPTTALRKLLGLDGGEEEPDLAHDPAAIVAIILIVINGHGIAIPDSAWARIRSFAEYGEIESWLRQVASADELDDLLV